MQALALPATSPSSSPRASKALLTATPDPTRVAVTVDADGSGDFTTPEEALAAVKAAAGGTVYVRAGTYLTNGLVVPSNTVLRGEGAATVIKSVDAARFNTVSTASGGANILIADLTIDGNRANQPLSAFSTLVINGPRTIVRGCWVTGSPGYGIVTYGQGTASGNDTVIEGNAVFDCAKEGIEIQATSRASIVGNVVRDCGYNAILVWANTAQGGISADVAVVGNTVSGFGLLTTASGIRVDDGATDVVVSGNVVAAPGRPSCFGIYVESATAQPVKRVAVNGNVVDGGNYAPTGIAHGGIGGTVTGNLVRAAGAGITVLRSASDVTVTGNTVIGSVANGISISAPAVVSSNALAQCGGGASNGIAIGADATVTGNRVTGSGGAGIAFGPGSSGACSANVVSDSRGCGIGVLNASNVAVTGNTATNNGTANNQIGIQIAQWSAGTVSGVVVTGNRCTDTRTTGKTQRYGIRVSGLVTDTLVATNLTSGNSVAGQLIDATASVTVGTP